MDSDVAELDFTDKYQAHAYWALMFFCGCGAGLEPPDDLPQFSKVYFERLALDAKEAGWALPDLIDGEAIPAMVCYCPGCSAKIAKAGVG